MSASIRLFVYGTLKPGECNYGYCQQQVIAAEAAIAFGALYALPLGYPAMTLGSSPVQGVLLSFADAAVLEQLDQLEDYCPSRPPEENEYNRAMIETFSPVLHPLGRAWVYLMQPDLVKRLGGVLLTSGVWTGHTVQ